MDEEACQAYWLQKGDFFSEVCCSKCGIPMLDCDGFCETCNCLMLPRSPDFEPDWGVVKVIYMTKKELYVRA